MEEIATRPYSVLEASKKLGITTRAVRFRMESGKLEGAQIDGKWVVFLPSSGEEEPSEMKETGRISYLHSEEGRKEKKEEAPQAVSVPPQMQMIMDTWLAPIVQRVEVLSRENGKLEAERELDGMEIARLREENKTLRRARTEDSATEPSFWARLLGNK